jgi:NADH-quinone oxidoreductase subunit D
MWLCEQITGNRKTYGMNLIGGVRRDITPELKPKILEVVDGIEKEWLKVIDAIGGDTPLMMRLKGIGVLTREAAIDYSALGPTARASDYDVDVRRDHPYGVYDRLKWNVITQKEGDVFAKAVVRILELYESASIVRQCLDSMREGPIDSKPKDIPPGEGIGVIEAPRGECFHYVKCDGTNSPVRHKIRAPTYMNFPTFRETVIGETVSDATIILAAIDPCYCCTERMVVVDDSDKELLKAQDLIRLSQEKTKKIKDRFGVK